MAVGVLYLPSVIHNYYAWDDWELFIHSPYLRSPALVLEGLVRPILPGTTYFRPLPLATFALEFNTVGVRAPLSHAINLTIHLLNALLVAAILARVLAALERPIGFRPNLAALLYAVHPALIEPTAWAAGRFDLMVTFFYLAGLLVFLSTSGMLRTGLVFMLFLVAAFSKEMAATFPLTLFILCLAMAKGQRLFVFAKRFLRGEWLIVALAIAAAGIVYLTARHHFMGRFVHSDRQITNAIALGGIDHLAFIGQTFVFYLRLVVWPFSDISPHHPFKVAEMSRGQIMAGLAALLLLASLTWSALRSRNLASLMLLAGFVSLLPVSNIIPLTIGGNIGHERFLDLPLAFFAMAVAAISIRSSLISSSMQRILPALVIGLIVCWVGLAAVNVRVTAPLWRDDLTLWKWAYDKNPSFYVVNIGYAGAAIRYQQYELAATALKHAESLNPPQETNRLPAKILESRVLTSRGDFVGAVQLLEGAVSELSSERYAGALVNLDPRITTILYAALTESYIGLGDFSEAQKSSEIAVKSGPRYALAWFYGALASYGLDQWSDGQRKYKQASGYILDVGVDVIATRREEFLKKLCAASQAPDVCSKWKSQ